MTAILPTAAEVAERYVPLRVENGRVAGGPFAGATATRDMRWDCLTLRCFVLDGWHIHEPRCDRDHAMPAPTGTPSPLGARLIADAELRTSGHMDPEPWNGCADLELMARQENARRGGDGR